MSVEDAQGSSQHRGCAKSCHTTLAIVFAAKRGAGLLPPGVGEPEESPCSEPIQDALSA